jgi:hypothetical protein
MNFIKRIQAERTELEAKVSKADDAISDTIGFLMSSKFVGVDSDGGRKDWIATGDMIAILQNLRSELR